MKKSVKWILGIGIGLVVIAVLVSVGFMVFNHWGGANGIMSARVDRGWNDGRGFRDFGMPMNRGGRMPAFGFGGFPLLRVLGGGLFMSGILALSIYGVISLVRSMRRSPQPVAVQAAGSPVASQPLAAAVQPLQAASHTCPNCTHAVQDDWSHCPYCGHALGAEAKPESPAV